MGYQNNEFLILSFYRGCVVKVVIGNFYDVLINFNEDMMFFLFENMGRMGDYLFFEN